MTGATSSHPASAVILMYHRVAVLETDVHRLCISPDTFRAHMSELRSRYRPTGLMELAGALVAGTVPPGSVAVTLDDGCLDNLTVASAILQDFDVPATFFVPTERLDQRREYWWDSLERVFYSTGTLPARLELPGADIYATETEEERARAHRLIAERIRGLPAEARDDMLRAISTWAGADTTPRDSHRPMLPDELQALATRPGHTIGAHGVHHLRFRTLAADQKRLEMLESKETLEALTGTDVHAVAYPYGDFDDETLALAGDLFSVGVTVESVAARVDSNPLALPRIDAGRLSCDELADCLGSVFIASERGSG